jgi:hypothetical protein
MEQKLQWFEKVLRKISGPKNDEGANLYTAPNIIMVIKSRRRWEGHVAHIAEIRIAYNILARKPEGQRSLEDLCVDWRIL